MRIAAALLISALTSLYSPAFPPTDDARDVAEEKARAALEARVRKLVPASEPELLRKAANDRLIALLGKAEGMEILRLDPKSGGSKKETAFHGYDVLRRVRVVSANERARLVASLNREIHWTTELRAHCFSPRHGLRVMVGKDEVDLVLCFECSEVKVYRNGEFVQWAALLGRTWEPAEQQLRATVKADRP